MQSFFISYKNSQVQVFCFGNGPVPVFCFHGYGEDGNMFSFLENITGYTFCAIDLPFHGKTKWNEGLNFTTEDLQSIIQKISEQLSTSVQKNKYFLLGFSLGGRMTLSLYEADPSLVKKLILLAPDGLKVNFWYWFSTQTWIGNKAFSFTMKKPDWFFGFLKLMNRFGWVNPSIFKFVNYYIGDPKIREQLYNRWTAFRHISPSVTHIKKYIVEHQTHLRLMYGLHDKIILPTRGEKFITGIEKFASLKIIECGHQVLHVKNLNQIQELLNN